MKMQLEKIFKMPVFEIRNGVKLQESLDLTNVQENQVLFVGRLEKDKGFDIVCELATQNPDINFVCAGEGSLRHLADDISNINLVGFVDLAKLGDLYKSSSLLIAPSTTQDPFGLVVIEALSYGCPVMCSNMVNASDYLDTQFVCRLEEFKLRFRDFFRNSSQLRKKAYQSSKEFDQQKMLSGYANFLNSL